VTFLFSDVEGSTRLWEAHGEEMRAALAVHDRIVRKALESAAGLVFSTGGDGFGAAFSRAGEAVAAALAAQRALADQEWPEAAVLRVRMGLHTGEADERGGDYFGPEVNRAARLMAIAHGGQIVCSPATADLVGGHLPAGVALVDVGAHRLRDLSEPLRVFQVQGDGLPSRFPALLSMDAFPGNLPLQVSSFIGREVELARVAKTLGETRVVTLTGVGGVGKTRLALRAAAEVLPRFREGAWLVELQAVRDPEAVPGAVAAVFRLADRAGLNTLESLIEFLRSKQLLLVLDNCEHLLDPVADLIDDVERACPGVVVLATSREGLALEGERVLPVPSLPAPAADADLATVGEIDAVRLFVDRAGWVDPDFGLTEGNASAVTQICQRLDGLPLAIELAAARVGAMTPAELARRLDRRFDILAGGRRRAVQRHQTLRAAIDWSYQLCSEGERRLLSRLAVFAGGCSEEAAEEVCGGDPLSGGQVFELLAGLVAKSLVVAQRVDSTSRYRLLETIREYSEDRLADYGETDPLRRRHAEYYCQFEAVVLEEFWGREQVSAYQEMAAERDNLLAAVNYAVDSVDVDLALRLVRHGTGPMQLGFALHLPIPAILDLPGAATHGLYPYALATSAAAAPIYGELDRVEGTCQEALRGSQRLSSQHERRWVEFLVAAAQHARLVALGQWREAASYAEQAAWVARGNGMESQAAEKFAGAATSYTMAGDPEAGVGVARQALELARAIDAPMTVSFCLVALAGAVAQSEPVQARNLLEEALAARESHNIETTDVVSQATLIAASMGDWPLTLHLADPAIRGLQWDGTWAYLGGVLNVVARAVAATDLEAAARLQGAARHLAPRPAAGTTTVQGRSGPDSPAAAPRGSSFITDLRRQTSALLHDAIDEGRLHQLRAEGEAMDSDHAAAYALEAIRRARGVHIAVTAAKPRPGRP
jgi:predicted ATPase/class 3 adenylate cyclase